MAGPLLKIEPARAYEEAPPIARSSRGRKRLRQPEDVHAVAQRVAQLEVAAAGHRDELLVLELVGHRSGVASGAGLELPEQLPGAGIVGVEIPVAFSGKDETAGRRQGAAHHRLRHLDLPRLLAGAEVERREQAILLLAGDRDEGRTEPQFSLVPRGVVGDVVHRLMEARYEGVVELG